MTDNFEKKVAVDGPVANEGELGSSTFSPGQVLPAGPLGRAMPSSKHTAGAPASKPPWHGSNIVIAHLGSTDRLHGGYFSPA